MRNLSQPVVNAVTNASTSFPAIVAGQLYAASFVAQFSDAAAAGTLKIQFSNDIKPSLHIGDFTPAVASWVDMPLATVTVVAGATSFPPMPLSICVQWLRIVWTRSAGAGTISVFMNAQGF